MSLTKIDCALAKGPRTFSQGELYSILNPIARPGCVVAGFVKAASDTVSGHISAKLALEHYQRSISLFLDQTYFSKAPELRGDGLVLEALECAFREANRSVYDFGHKLAAGGRLGASLLGLVICDSFVAVAKSDSGSVYIIRDGEIVPFFVEEDKAAASSIGGLNLVGANSLVNVELSSLPLEADDVIVAFSRTIEISEEAKLIDCVQSGLLKGSSGSKFVLQQLFSSDDKIPTMLIVSVGPEGIYLQEAI